MAVLRSELPNCVVSLSRQRDYLPHYGLIRRDARYTVEEAMELANENGFTDETGQPFTDVDQFLCSLELAVAKEPEGLSES